MSWFSSAASQQGKLAQPMCYASGVRLLPIFELAHFRADLCASLLNAAVIFV